MNKQQTGRRMWLLAAGVAVVGIVVAATVWNRGSAGLLFLLILVCPLMMLFMMGSMGRYHVSGSNEPHVNGSVSEDSPDLTGLSRDEKVRALRGQLTKMAWRHEALRRDLEQLETERVVDADKTADTR